MKAEETARVRLARRERRASGKSFVVERGDHRLVSGAHGRCHGFADALFEQGRLAREQGAVHRLSAAGCLRYGLVYEQPAYLILDSTNPCNVQCRRMDGQLWFERSKVMGVRGNWAAWPVGLSALDHMPGCHQFLLVEGTGDYLAAWDLRSQLGQHLCPVAMFGASQGIHEGALPLFSGQRVLIVQQHDEAGARASERWAAQLRTAGATVSTWLCPTEGHDLNDFLSAAGESPDLSTLSTHLS